MWEDKSKLSTSKSSQNELSSVIGGKFAPVNLASLSHQEALVVGVELGKIKADGPLTAAAVVLRAKDPRSPLHRFFEWNDTFAAAQHRQAQAQTLVRHVAIVFRKSAPSGSQEVPASLPVVIGGQSKALRPASAPAYLSVSESLSGKAGRQKMLKLAISEARSWLRRYSDLGLDELNPICEAIETISQSTDAFFG